jgi:hypothetical protein
MIPKKSFLFITFLMIINNSLAQQPPYSGTIFIDPDIITANDPTTFVSSSYTGRGMRTVFDRRTNSFIDINAFLFKVVWNDNLTSEAQINPEFGDQNTAGIEAEKYGKIIGQLPYSLRVDVAKIWIHKGVQLFGGGNNSILIHTGQTSLYEADGILEETIVHEATHTSLDATHAASTGWINAQKKDANFISTYARDNPTREDVAESFLLWLATKQCTNRISQQNYNTITQTIPNRIAYFNSQNFNVSPVCINTLGFKEFSTENIDFYPNPASKIITINATENNPLESAEIITIEGKSIMKESINGSVHTIDIGHFNNGIYFLVLNSKDKNRYVKKWVKI